MKREKYPILEFDPTPRAVIEPTDSVGPSRLPQRCVICFFRDFLDRLCAEEKLRTVCELRTDMGPIPVYELEFERERLTVVHPGVGPSFAACCLEEIIALGCRKFIACGGAGVLQKDIKLGEVIIVESALRDEGASYHYLPPSREVSASREAIKAIEETLRKHKVDYRVGKTWTTSAIYRETPGKVKLRRDEGCLTVEMECAALYAVAKFRGVMIGQLVYSGDDVSGEQWDTRDWNEQIHLREKLFWLAAEACWAL